VLAKWYGIQRGGVAVERIIGRMDYPRLEKQIRFYYKDDLYEAIRKLGFEQVSECIAKLYYGQGLSSYEVATFLPVTASTVNRWMATWGMKRRNEHKRGIKWSYDKFCIDCGEKTSPGYRARGRCWPCYMKFKREEANLSSQANSR